jgi:FK506-binding protein 6
MTKINDKIYKNVIFPGYGKVLNFEKNMNIVYKYSMFLEGHSEPFDSNQITRQYSTLHTDDQLFVIPGHALALNTMKNKEEALFWISHELMYGELGIYPRVPPKADILVCLRIVRVLDIKGDPVEMKINNFEMILSDAARALRKGNEKFENKDYDSTAKLWEKWIAKLESLHLKNEEEEKAVKKYLVKLYRNLCVCYNKMKLPKKTCIALKLLQKLSPIEKDKKSLYEKVKAAKMLNDYEEALKYMIMLRRLDPDSRSVMKMYDELENLKVQFETYQNNFDNRKEKLYAEFKLETKSCANDCEKPSDASVSDKNLNA